MTEAGKRLIEAARKAREKYHCIAEPHCADQVAPLVQCDHCEWSEKPNKRGNYEDRIKNNC